MYSHHDRNNQEYRSGGLLLRIKRLFRRNRWLLFILLLTSIVVIGSLVWFVSNLNEFDQVDIVADNARNVGTGYRNITYQGKNYQYNNRITAILYAGLDSDTPLVQTTRYGIAPRADSISLIVLDELHKKMTIIGLSRDTMTQIRKYTKYAELSYLAKDHLCYSYTYGNGGKASCEGMCEAVSLLLFGVPIKDYVVSNRLSMDIISNIIGPVEVIVPNNDLAEIDAQYAEGAKVSIDAQNLEFFVRHRDSALDLSNVGRMQRQQVYITGAMENVRKIVSDRPTDFWNELQVAEACVQTNITRSRYLELVRIMKNTAFSKQNYYIPEGENVVGTHYDEFYPDESSLLAKVVELFYIKQ